MDFNFLHIALIIVGTLILIWVAVKYARAENFSSRAQTIIDKFGVRISQGPPVFYSEFKRKIPDGDAVEFNAVRELTVNRDPDVNRLSQLL